MSDCLSAKLVTARKPHNCTVCGSLIAIGNKYERSVNTDDGEMYTLKTCMACYNYIQDNCSKCDGQPDCFEEYEKMVFDCMMEAKNNDN